MRRARSSAVLAMLLAGAIGVIASTQTWIDVTLDDGAQQTLAVRAPRRFRCSLR